MPAEDPEKKVMQAEGIAKPRLTREQIAQRAALELPDGEQGTQVADALVCGSMSARASPFHIGRIDSGIICHFHHPHGRHP